MASARRILLVAMFGLLAACAPSAQSAPPPTCQGSITQVQPDLLRVSGSSNIEPGTQVQVSLFANGQRVFHAWVTVAELGSFSVDVPTTPVLYSVYWVGLVEGRLGTLCEASLYT